MTDAIRVVVMALLLALPACDTLHGWYLFCRYDGVCK